MKKTIYLDFAAATPLDGHVLAVMQPYFTEKFYNPSALYLDSKAVHKDVNTAHELIAKTVGVRPSEIICTSGGTEANNLALHGVMRLHAGANVVVSAIEHDSVLKPAHAYEYKEARVNSDGRVDISALEQQIDDKTVLVSVMYANNEIGTTQPLSEIAHMIKTVRYKRMLVGNKLPIYLHTDACQAANYMHLNASKLGVDMMTLNGGKIYGPKQSGALVVRSNVILQPQILGGGQEFGKRSGTENVAGIMGFSAALEMAQAKRSGESMRLQKIQDFALAYIAAHLPKAVINGSGIRLPNNIHFSVPGTDNERVIMLLDEQGIQAAVGSACSASSNEPSHVLKAIGLSDEMARSALRFTMGRNTTEADVESALVALVKIVA